jgi:hypothetical protein
MRWLLAFAVLAATACHNKVPGGGEGEVFEGEGEGAGEGEGEGAQCASGPVFGILVEAFDSCSGFPVCNATATITPTGGQTPVTLTPTTDTSGGVCGYVGASDQAGTFDVDVTDADYDPAHFASITVSTDPCGHAIQRLVDATMTPTSGCAGQ